MGSYRNEKIGEVEKNIDLIARATSYLTEDLKGTLIVGANANDRRRDILYAEAKNFWIISIFKTSFFLQMPIQMSSTLSYTEVPTVVTLLQTLSTKTNCL